MIDDDDLDYEEELATETEHRPKIKKAVASRAATNYFLFSPDGLLRHHPKDRSCRDRRHLPLGIFFPFSLEHGCFFIWIADK